MPREMGVLECRIIRERSGMNKFYPKCAAGLVWSAWGVLSCTRGTACISQ